jgi:CubicO group peptidase (beta-lactamase class C family)
VASISKCFVAGAIMQLVEQGKIQLDLPIVEYLPDFQMNDERYGQITIRQMLSHTSGIPDMDEAEYDQLVYHPEYDEAALERYVHTLASSKLIAAPGERFAYSNIACNVLSYLIARISGKSFEGYMKENILLPAGMPDSSFFFPEIPPHRLAVPHLRTPTMIVNPIYPYHRADAAASFLHSTVIDMCHWAITCLACGVFNSQRILSQVSYDQMWSPVADRGNPPFYEHHGLGWVLGHFDGIKTVSHGGGGFGWTDFLIMLPEKRCGAIILCNEESSARGRTIRAVLHCMLDKEPIVDTVSWMVPISHAFAEGGLPAAYACYDEIKDRTEYFFEENELIGLAIQLCSVKKRDMAIDVLEFNAHIFPEHLDSLIFLAKLYMQKGDHKQAESAIQKTLALDPDNKMAQALLLEASA